MRGERLVESSWYRPGLSVNRDTNHFGSIRFTKHYWLLDLRKRDALLTRLTGACQKVLGDNFSDYAEERMERSVEVLAIILFGILGLSHILQPKAWAEFFILLRGKGEAGAFVDGFLNLPLGGVIVGFHNTWSGIPLVLTLVGWGLLIKGLIRFCAPKQALRMMARVSLERSWEFQVAGAGLVALASLLGYGVYAG